jgi:hypothetical protein
LRLGSGLALKLGKGWGGGRWVVHGMVEETQRGRQSMAFEFQEGNIERSENLALSLTTMLGLG